MELDCRFILAVVFFFSFVNGDTPCAARHIIGQSVICVCNATYCDTVTRDAPATGSYVAYISSKDGLRFRKTTGTLITAKGLGSFEVTLHLKPSEQFQTIFGFGGAVTDAAGINWRNLPEPLQTHFVNSYFSDKGLQYNMVRVPIGGADFSTRPYAYNDLPEDDVHLSNFSLSYEDIQYKIPLIKAGMAVSKTPIHVVGSTWSPPPWMKTNRAYGGNSRLKTEYYQTFADYIYKFIEKYSEAGVPIWGVTTTNEPTNGVLGLGKFNSLGWTAATMGDWIINNLGPTLRNSSFKDTKILAVDDQRLFLFYWWNKMIQEKPKVLDYLDGAALHYYSDFITPASLQVEAMRSYPNKFLLNTEACGGTFPWQQRVEPGSWQRAYSYVTDIITNLNHESSGWIDWNLCVDSLGGPNWDKNYADAAVTISTDHSEFHKQPMFYAMGHFSKFITRGSKRIGVLQQKSLITSFESVAVLTPENTVVVIFYNKGSARKVTIRLDNQITSIDCPATSLVTVELPYEH